MRQSYRRLLGAILALIGVLGCEDLELTGPGLGTVPLDALRPVSKHEAELLISPHLKAGEWLDEIRIVPLPESGRLLIEASVKSPASVRRLVIDDSGEAHSKAELLNFEQELRTRRYGKLTRDLHNRAVEQSTDELIPVSIRLNLIMEDPTIPADLPDDFSAFKRWVSEQRAATRSRINTLRQPVVELLISEGAENITTFDNLPIIQAHLPPSKLVSQTLNSHPAIGKIRLLDTQPFTAMLGTQQWALFAVRASEVEQR